MALVTSDSLVSENWEAKTNKYFFYSLPTHIPIPGKLWSQWVPLLSGIRWEVLKWYQKCLNCTVMCFQVVRKRRQYSTNIALVLLTHLPGIDSQLGWDFFSLLLSLWAVLRSNPPSAKQWISQMQLAMTFRAKYYKKEKNFFFKGKKGQIFLKTRETQENECFFTQTFWGVCWLNTERSFWGGGKEDEDNWGTGVRQGNKPIVDLWCYLHSCLELLLSTFPSPPSPFLSSFLQEFCQKLFFLKNSVRGFVLKRKFASRWRALSAVRVEVKFINMEMCLVAHLDERLTKGGFMSCWNLASFFFFLLNQIINLCKLNAGEALVCLSRVLKCRNVKSRCQIHI